MPASATAPEPAGLAAGPGFGIYVHWPFCLSKCPYCDFNSHVRATVDQSRWRAALVRELAHFAPAAEGRIATSIFFGGGTPSLMEPATVAAVIEAVARHWPLDPAIEITLEANPTSVEAGRFAGYRAAGVGRVSLGVQALEDAALAALGRQHSAAEARAAVELAHRIFPRVSFDLIYARPGQTAAAWRRELRDALELAGEHLSLYQLTIEENTGFHGAWRRGRLVLPAEPEAALLYETTQELCAAAGRPAYEISNHARPGAESRHNLTYWRYGEYLGVGPGAHGRIALADGRRLATRQETKPEAWIAGVESRGHGTAGTEAVAPSEQAAEMLMMGLRLAEGIDLARLESAAGQPLGTLLAPRALARLEQAGLLVRSDGRLAASAAGRAVLNSLLVELLG